MVDPYLDNSDRLAVLASFFLSGSRFVSVELVNEG